MKTYTSFVCTILESYKDRLQIIPVLYDNKIIGILSPVTRLYKIANPEYVSLICKWREENPIGFANSFKGTEQKTEYWLDKILLPRKDRILFMIYTLNFKPVGHLGFSNFDFENKSCEIDNVVRGVKEGNAGIMTQAIKTLIIWAKRDLKIKHIYLKVLKDNFHAIKFYEKIGFTQQYNIPLFENRKEGLIEWIEMENPENRKPDRFYICMKLF